MLSTHTHTGMCMDCHYKLKSCSDVSICNIYMMTESKIKLIGLMDQQVREYCDQSLYCNVPW